MARPDLRALPPLVALSLLVLALLRGLPQLPLNPYDLLDPDDPIRVSYERYQAGDPDAEDLVLFLIGGDRLERLKRVEAIGKRLASRRDLYEDVLYRFDLEPFLASGLYFLDIQDLKRVSRLS